MPPPTTADELDCDVVLVGGGIAALWTLDALDEAGFAAVLLEPAALGQGQTLASQGIIHGGLKYTLRGLLNPAAESISAMPDRWRQSLANEARPHLAAVAVRSPCTWLWRSTSLVSKIAMLGARIGLRAQPVEVAASERPAVLGSVPGTVYRVDEPVLDTMSLIEAFRASHRTRMLAADGLDAIKVDRHTAGYTIDVRQPDGGTRSITCRAVVLAAGAANEHARERCGLSAQRMQRRPLHMVVLRGALPELHGHCVDGTTTRVTITTAHDAAGRAIWQIGGQLAEAGVAHDRAALLAHARRELQQVLPDFDASGVEWATYRIDRAELATTTGLRPDDAQCIADGPPGLITVWPTKLALAPRAADLVIDALAAATISPSGPLACSGQRPDTGQAPWESLEWSR
ncbi:MAG: FAD-dependent oxidoreductase [Phycisphaerae bacterium]|nr:FAD-dependent oxidoreductase [Phycisphaerae bacterium]